jgi:hypothetical protein
MLIADLNEFVFFFTGGGRAYAAGQAADGSPYSVVILRATYSNSHVDTKYVSNLAEARAAGLLVDHYGYMNQATDAASQGTFFGETVKAHGGLRPGEAIYCDCEEGGGDQAPRVEAFLAAAHAVLGDPVQDEGEYSGASFFVAHLGTTPSGFHRWIAAYQPSDPKVPGEEEWQFTDHQTMPGVSAPCDCTIFNGTLAQYKARFSPPAPAPAPTPPAGPAPAPKPTQTHKEMTVQTAQFADQLHTLSVVPNGDLVHRWQPEGSTVWGGPEVLGSGFVYPQTPGVDAVHNGHLNVFADKADGSQVHFWQAPGQKWQSEPA